MNPKQLWTKERFEKLRVLWAKGHSASEVAAALGGFAHTKDGGRSAVTGKAHRERLPREIDTIHWSEADIAALTMLWLRGYPAKEIAQKLGGEMSSGAVIAAARSRGLQSRGRMTYRRADSGEPNQPVCERMADGTTLERLPVPEPTAEDLAIPHERRRTLLELTADTCKWPVGEPGTPGFFFCGARPVSELPYCAAHCSRAYVRPDARPEAGRGESDATQPEMAKPSSPSRRKAA